MLLDHNCSNQKKGLIPKCTPYRLPDQSFVEYCGLAMHRSLDHKCREFEGLSSSLRLSTLNWVEMDGQIHDWCQGAGQQLLSELCPISCACCTGCWTTTVLSASSRLASRPFVSWTITCAQSTRNYRFKVHQIRKVLSVRNHYVMN